MAKMFCVECARYRGRGFKYHIEGYPTGTEFFRCYRGLATNYVMGTKVAIYEDCSVLNKLGQCSHWKKPRPYWLFRLRRFLVKLFVDTNRTIE